ncbi:MAG: 30S ribosomal protein S2 [Ignavibacteriae bacterium]|nr:MAG: 30S ribosomal protein S2 [Ignavibacteriota bacterium]
MSRVDLIQLIKSGAHFGHLTRRWNPKMKPYIFMEKNGIHIIDLKKTQQLIDVAAEKLNQLASEGKTVLFVGTKKQAQAVIDTEAKKCGANWVSERWLGGMLTNFSTIRKSVKRLHNIEKQETDGTFEKITKKEILFLSRERDKLKKVLGGIETMNRLPGALFIVDIRKESIAVNEARKLNIPVFAIVDTNCDPDDIDYIIPANDDAVKTIELITSTMADAILEGEAKLKERKAEEAAERERIKKEREKEKEEEKKKIDAERAARKAEKEKEAEEKKKAEAESKKDEKETKEVKMPVNAEKSADEKKEETVKDEKSKDVIEVKEEKSSSDSE